MTQWQLTFKTEDTQMWQSFVVHAENRYQAALKMAKELRIGAYDVSMRDILGGIFEIESEEKE